MSVFIKPPLATARAA